jgi:hypothetical protein
MDECEVVRGRFGQKVPNHWNLVRDQTSKLQISGMRGAVVIPLIPFFVKLQAIRETRETGAEVTKSLETSINTGYYR